LLRSRVPPGTRLPADEDEDLVALRAERERVLTQLHWSRSRGDLETSEYLTETLAVLESLIEERLRELNDDVALP
jgi:hypothetical protein